jgi:hypothetical protein
LDFSPTVLFLGIKVFPFGAVNSDLYATQGPLFGPRVLLPCVIAYGDQPTKLKLTVFSQTVMVLEINVSLESSVFKVGLTRFRIGYVFGFRIWVPYLDS